jgi:hypothetical protein
VRVRVRYVVHLIVLGVQQEGRRRVGADADVRAQAQVRPRRPQVAGVDDNSEVRSAAQLIGGIQRRIRPLREVRADGSGEVPAGGKADYADLVRVDMPLRGVLAETSPARTGVVSVTYGPRPRPSAPLFLVAV